MTRKIKTEITVENPIKLEDLRWLVDRCKGLPGDCDVIVKEYKEHAPNDWDNARITVVDNETI